MNPIDQLLAAAKEQLDWQDADSKNMALSLAITAVEEWRRGKKPVARDADFCRDEWTYYTCPSCEIELSPKMKYCPDCGLKLNWE